MDPWGDKKIYTAHIGWENGEPTDEPLLIIDADDTVNWATYAKDNNLLHQPGWEILACIPKRQTTSSVKQIWPNCSPSALPQSSSMDVRYRSHQ